MKKTFVKLGVLAVALALVFAACAQPTDEEEGSGTNAPTIVRLHLDKQETVDFVNTTFEIRIGEELYITPAGAGLLNYFAINTYPYALVPGQNDGKTNAQNFNDVDIADRTKVLAIPATAPSVATGPIAHTQTVLQYQGKKKFLASGILRAVPGKDDNFAGTVLGAGIQTDNDDKTQRYIDIELVDVKPGSKGYGSVYSGSISGYLELAVSVSTVADSGVKDDTTYLYTKDKHGFNDFLRMATAEDVAARLAAGGPPLTIGQPLYGVRNANIKKVSLKPGINDIYLSFFSYAQYNE
jgi:hypothetical protein